MIFQDSITMIKGVGSKTTALFSKLHIETAGELLYDFPREYDHFETPVCISKLTAGKVMAVRAVVIGTPSTVRAKSLVITRVKAGDVTGCLWLTYFRMPYIKNTLKPGMTFVFRGMVQKGAKDTLTMEHPRIYTPEEYEKLAGTLQPRYGLTAGITNHMISKCMRQVLSELPIEEYLPAALLDEYRLLPLKQAFEWIHFPPSMDEMLQARRRLVFDEFMAFLIQIKRQKEHNETLLIEEPMSAASETDSLIQSLPYALTGAQKRVWQEIENDLQSHVAMNRLVQGDVGSGKTILAFLAMLLCAANGRQACLMAPTEVLAAQHYEALASLIKEYALPITPVLLIGSMTAKQKREAYERIAVGEANAIIGTHALIQEKVKYRKLGLVITDEQHRFGVRQREMLAQKGEAVHVLVMSATPIPRTLAIVLYGDLHVSMLDELPANRLPIKNCVVNTDYRPKAYTFLQNQISQGRQAYVICPMVEEGEMEGVENVTDYTEKLRAALPDSIRIASLHGKMKADEKQRIMDAYAAHELDILVSTTVIEVGINVPNATVMLVENAERFGLAQLHQLRGRVGRGKDQSYCIFMTGDDSGGKNERLNVLNRSNDGFYIANEDLKLRGPGDLFGVRQSGLMEFALGDIYQDSDILLYASQAADQVLCDQVHLDETSPFFIKKEIDYRSI